MPEKTIPWWRKALNFALGGIRSGIGLLFRPAKPENLEEFELYAGLEENLEEETVLNHSLVNPEIVPADAVAVAEAAPPVETVAIAEAERVDAVAATAPDLPVEAAAETDVKSVAVPQEVGEGEEMEVTRPADHPSIVVAGPVDGAPGPRAEAAESRLNPGEIEAVIFSGLEALPDSTGVTRELRPPPPSASSLSAAHAAQVLVPLTVAVPQAAEVEVVAPIEAEDTVEVVPDPAPGVEPEAQAVVGPEVGPDIEEEPGPHEEAEAEVEAERVPPADTDAEVEAVAPIEPQAVVELVPELAASAETEAVPELEPEIEEEHGAEPQAVAESEAEPVPEAESETGPNPEPAPELEPEAEAEPIAEGTEPVPEAEPAPGSLVAEPRIEAAPETAPAAEAAEAAEPAPAEEAAQEPGPAAESTVSAAGELTAAAEAATAADAVAEPAPLAKPAVGDKEAARLAARQRKLDEGSEQSPFSVIVGQVYDGPLDLLLDLIRKQDIDIYDIPIATITAQFLAYVNQLKASDVDVAGEFIYTASLLIHIKSKMLLPRAPSGPEDAAEDPRRELVERLLEHERFKNAAQMLQQKQMLEAASWTNPGAQEFKDDAGAEPEIAADTVDLVRIFRDILERARKRPVIDVTEDSVTVGQMIQFLARRLTMEDKPVALRRLLSHTRSERALIAMFLALLELVRLQAILLRQDRAFSEIFIKKHTGFDAVMNEGLMNARDDWR
jgi:segregation and condensation protein A